MLGLPIGYHRKALNGRGVCFWQNEGVMCGCLVELIAGLRDLRHQNLRHASIASKTKPLPALTTSTPTALTTTPHTSNYTLYHASSIALHTYSRCTEPTACASRAPRRRRKSRTHLRHPHLQRPVASLAAATLVSSFTSSLLSIQSLQSIKPDFFPRAHIPRKGRRRLWTRSR